MIHSLLHSRNLQRGCIGALPVTEEHKDAQRVENSCTHEQNVLHSEYKIIIQCEKNIPVMIQFTSDNCSNYGPIFRAMANLNAAP